ncbi:ABC transporter substrate-binding protein [Litoribacillus peritrichatus]|uniref:ABC transporter substrate-binding protein n=1 Tax=Litoribacillus peritrichatus TaxID=718191 RepID=A0ABP7MEN0_9GAMM
MYTKINSIVLIALLLTCINTRANDQPIRIITNNWTSQVVLSKVTGELFKSLGYQVEYISSATSDQWGALVYGAGHVQVEVWEGTMSDVFNRLVAEGSIVDAGTHDAKTREDWWYPAYVEDICPGLPDWRALKACSKLFSTSGEGRGIYFAGPWEKPDEARIRALDMGFNVKILANGDDLWVELKKANAIKKPIVLFNWTPNWVESRFEGAFVEFPVHARECETDPEWGENPNYLYDCGNPKGGWLKKAAWKGMEKTWNCAYRTLKNISFNNQQIASASALVDVDKLSYEQAVRTWLDQNKDVWVNWIPEGCNK